MPVDPQLAAFLPLFEGGTPFSVLGPVKSREVFRQLTVDARDAASLAPADVADTEVDGAVGARPARVYRPVGHDPAATPLPTVVFLHGGGFVIGDLDTHDALCRTLCVRADVVVLSVDYRLAPEHPFPAAADDAVAAVRWAAARLGELGGGDRLGVAGDSAGGNLSAVATQALRDGTPGADGTAVPLAAQLLLYPAVDVPGEYASRTENAEGYFLTLETMTWFLSCYAAEVPPEELTQPGLSPLHGDLAGLPPAVVVTAEFDPLRDEGDAYASALAAAGVEVDHVQEPGLIHGFADMGAISEACRRATEGACDRFGALLHR